MKAFLKFDLPEDQEKYEICNNALKMFDNAPKYDAALCDFDHWLRSQIKHGDKDWQEVRDKLHECLADRGVSIL